MSAENNHYDKINNNDKHSNYQSNNYLNSHNLKRASNANANTDDNASDESDDYHSIDLLSESDSQQSTRVKEPIFNKGIIQIILFTILFGALNKIAETKLASIMAKYPSFRSYCVISLAIPIFGLIALYKKESLCGFNLRSHLSFVLFGFLMTLEWTIYHHTATWIDNNMQQILAMAIVPFVLFFERYIDEITLNKKHIYTTFAIAVFTISAIIPSAITTFDRKKDPIHPLISRGLFVFNVLFQALVFVLQKKMVCGNINSSVSDKRSNPSAIRSNLPSEASCLFWTNLYAIPFLILSIPLESLSYSNGLTSNKPVTWAFENQLRAFKCFASSDDCGTSYKTTILWVWLIIAVIFYALSIFMLLYLATRTSAFRTVSYQIVMAMASVTIYACRELVMDDYAQMSPYTVIMFMFCLCAMICFNGYWDSSTYFANKIHSNNDY
jgi:hypothetical protein